MGKRRYLPSANTFRKISVAISLLTIVVGVVGLAGWFFGFSYYTQPFPHTVRITVNTSICMVLLGMALWLRVEPGIRRRKRRLAQALALLVSCLGGLSLLEIVFGWDLHIDQLFIVPSAQEAIGTVRPGLMSPITAICFVLLGIGMATLDWTTRKGYWPAQVLAATAEFGSSFALLDFLLSPLGHHLAIAPQTAIVLCAFPIGLLAARPERGLPKLLLDVAPLWSREERSFSGRFQSSFLRYGSTVVLVALAAALRIWLGRYGVSAPFLTFYPAVMVSCLLAGVGPGILCVLLSAVCVDYLFIPPQYRFGMDTLSDSISIAMFILTCTGFCLLLGLVDLHRQRALNEIQKAERVLHEQAALLDLAHDAIFVRDADARIHFWNQGAADLYGWTPEDAFGQVSHQLLQTEFPVPEDTIEAEVSKRGEWEGELIHLRRDGKRVAVTSRWSVQRDKQGKVVGCLEINRDITDRKQAEAALKSERQRFETMLDSLPAMICLLTPDHHVAFANYAMRKDFGTPDGRTCHQYLFERDTPCDFCEAFRVLESKSPHDWEVKLTTGATVHVYNVPFTDSDGSPLILEMDVDVTEQRKVEEALRQSEAELKEAQRIARVGSWELDLSTGRVRWTEELFRMFGMEPAIGAPPFEAHPQLFSPESWKILGQAVDNLARTGEPYELEVETVRADGSHGWMYVRGEAMHDADGNIARLRGIARDVTERKQAAEHLERSEARYHSLVTATAQIVWTTAPSGEVVEDVPMWREYCGATLEQIRGWGWIDSIHPDDRARTQDAWNEALRKRSSYEMEYRLRRRDGEYRTVIARGVPVLESDGTIREWIGTCTDITESKLAESSLRESEERYRSVVTAMAEGVVVQGADGKITTCNASGEKILGIVAEQLKAQTSTDLEQITVHEDGSPFPGETHPAMVALQTGQPQSRVCMGIRKADGTITWILVNAQPMVHPGESQPYAVVTTFTDITERKLAEQKVIEERQKFNSILDVLTPYVVLLTPDYHVAFANHEFRRRFGESHGKRCYEFLFNRTEPCEICETYKVLETGKPQDWEWTGPDARSYEIHDFPFTDVDGAKLILEMGIDVTERKNAERKLQRVNRTLQLLSECTELLMRATDETTMLQSVCDATVQVGGYRMAWVGYAEHDESKTVRPMAEAGIEQGYLHTANVTWADEDRGNGPVGTAIRSGQVIVCNDTHSDPQFAPWREEALRRGYGSLVALPLKGEEELFGALTIYAAESDAFDRREQRLLEELANNTSYAILTLRARANQRQAEQAREESETRFRVLANFVPQMVWMCHADGMNFYFNQRWIDYTGMNLEESYGEGWSTPFHPDDKQAAWDAWRHSIATGETYHIESRLRAGDGTYRWFLMRGMPLMDAEGTITRWFGTCTDIHDMKLAEEQLRSLNLELEKRVAERTIQLQLRIAELQALFETAPIGLGITYDPQGTHITGNSRFERMLSGDPGGELAYGSPSAPPYRVIRDGRECTAEELPMQRAVAHEERVEGEILDVIRPDGSGIILHSSATPLFDEHGKVRGAIGAFVDITEQRRMEDALRASEERLVAVIENSPVGIWVVDARGKVTAKNKAADLIWRGDAPLSACVDDYTAYVAWDAETGKQLELDDYPLATTLRTGLPVNRIELRIRRFDGTDGYIMMSTAPLKGADGTLNGAVGINVDISARKHAEAALRDSEQLLRAVTENSPDAIYVKDVLSRWLMGNPAALRVVRKTAEQALGKTDLELHDDAAVGREILENDKRVIEGGTTEAFEEVIDTPDGRCTFLSVKAPRRDAQGKVVGLVGISHDITERKRQEELLRQSEMRFRSLANSVPDLVWTCTPDGKCDDVNSRYIEYTGVPKEALLGFEWLKQVHPDDRERALAEWRRAMEQDSLYESDFRIRNKDGEYRYFKSRGVAVRDEQGAILKWFGSNTDIEDLRRYQEQLTAVNKELESFNYAVAHDLRAPLRHVRGFSDLLIQEAGQGLSDTAQHYLTVIQDGVSRMSQLIEDLLNLSRIGRQDIRKQNCDIRPLIDQLIVELQPQIEGRNIEWHIAKVPLVVCDPSLFKQVLANLLSNALKFTRGCDPAIIEVGYKRAAGDLIIFVRDNGVGFDMKYLDKLFGLFQRLHRQEDFEGTGIGLAIVQRIMHRHGGKVWAEAALNHGATFYVSLHSAEPETPEDQPTEQGR